MKMENSKINGLFWGLALAISALFTACGSDSSSGAVNGGVNSKTAWDYLNPNVTYGEITDPRDGQVYKTVSIGTQTWMAENLNYADSIPMPDLAGNSWCYGNRADSCAKYGRLYSWTASMNIASSYQSASASAVILSPHQGACPAGWHIPTNTEWTTLVDFVGGEETAGTKLKSRKGWVNNGNGTDAYGFSALPAGRRDCEGALFIYGGLRADFWSATCDTDCAYYQDSYYYFSASRRDRDYEKEAFSVRCVKD